MNVGDGGSQPKMHSTIRPGGQQQEMVTQEGIAKGLKSVPTDQLFHTVKG